MSKQQKRVRNGAVQVRRGKKLTTLIWNQKKECNLAVTQILHLHLFKTDSPVCFPGFPSLCFSLISLFFLLPSASFRFHVLWLGALSFSACFIFTVHSVRVCVLIVVVLGERENDEEDLFDSNRARFSGTTQHGVTDTWSA